MTEAEPPPVPVRRWPMIVAGALTLLMIAGLARQLLNDGLTGLWRDLPTDPRFYGAFVLLYISPILFDWLIFNRLWGLSRAGIAPLVRKRVANDVVVGYSGEAYFYAWARARPDLVAAPFGAVKDVTILSAIAGNVVTLAVLAAALPAARGLLTPEQFRLVVISAAVTLAMSLPFLVFARRVFTLPRATLTWIGGMHTARILAGSLLIALAWHFALPDVALAMLLFLAAARLLVSRLPFVPNKDLVFANLAILLIGKGAALSDVVAFTAALTLAVHVALIAGFGGRSLVSRAQSASV